LTDTTRKSHTTKPLSAAELDRLQASRRALVEGQTASLLIYHRDGVSVVPLQQGQSVVVGTVPPADVCIRDASLSREHVAVELVDDEIWVTDLDSTNGTMIEGEPITRARVWPGTELTFGAVVASIHAVGPTEPRRLGLDSHDNFLVELEAELSRARIYQRTVSMLVLRGDPEGSGTISRWFPEVQQHLRRFDRVALYSGDTLELLLPELSEEAVAEFVQRLLEGETPLLCGISQFPRNAASAEELLAVALEAVRRADAGHRVRTAPAIDQAEVSLIIEPDEGDTVIRSAAMVSVFDTARRLAPSAIPVLVTGETGTGKELVARTIAQWGPRKDRPLTCVNCAGIPSQLVEATLFGHERGAFTGASQRSKGVFESADGGTVFLDEIGELPPQAQAAMLRVLEDKHFCRVGSTKEIEVDVRVIAATHRDLEAMCEAGDFRWDLLYRLNAMTLHVPPLRERIEEIAPLIQRFIRTSAEDNNRPGMSIDASALVLLEQYSWPGNVRELRNAVERAVVIARGQVIGTEDLPQNVRELALSCSQEIPRVTFSDGEDDEDEDGEAREFDLRREMERYEGKLILDALRKVSWDRAAAAAALNMPLRTLARKMANHGIRKVSYEQGEE
jgi:two-component system, NtrC family, response regulator AtoC